MDERSHVALQAMVLSTVRDRAADLAARWESQAKAVALMPDDATNSTGERLSSEGLVHALLGALDPGADEPEQAIEHGLHFGSGAFLRGSSLHHVMKALDLLSAMTLYAVETVLDESEMGGGPADGLRLARQLQRRSALLSLSATRGYMQAYAEALRERFRHLRHDLRNPLGTIKSVLSLMTDETVPIDARADPRFQVMARRNARMLEELIADRLSDAAALLPLVADQDVVLRSIACGVRRELRDETERHGVTVFVGADGQRGRLDAPGLELLLRGALQAVLQECAKGEHVHLDFDGAVSGRAVVTISCDSGRRPLQDADGLARLTALAHQIGASITADDRVHVSVPMSNLQPGAPTTSATTERERPIPIDGVDLRNGDARDDVGGPRQREHGESGAL